MRYEWDHRKAISNIKKHSVNFSDAVSVLEDEMAITIHDGYAGEERFITLGLDSLGRVLVVVYTWRCDRIRIISARKATPREQKQYKE